MAKFTKGHPGNLKGRGKNNPNVTTKAAREMLNKILFAELENIRESLKTIRIKDEAKYLEILSKLLAYSLPRKTDITSDDEPIQPITGIKIIKDGT